MKSGRKSFSLEDCIKSGDVRKAAPDRERAKSLLEQANSDELLVEDASHNAVTISSQVSVAYSSLRSALEAVCLMSGYKVSSHICVGEVAKSFIPEFKYASFDRFRYVRNGIIYYGTKISLEEGTRLIGDILAMKRTVLDYAERKWKLGVK